MFLILHVQGRLVNGCDFAVLAGKDLRRGVETEGAVVMLMVVPDFPRDLIAPPGNGFCGESSWISYSLQASLKISIKIF